MFSKNNKHENRPKKSSCMCDNEPETSIKIPLKYRSKNIRLLLILDSRSGRSNQIWLYELYDLKQHLNKHVMIQRYLVQHHKHLFS